MKPVLQTDTSEKGNCFQACVASLFEMPLDDVPNFCSLRPDWWGQFQKWLDDRGMVAIEITLNPSVLSVCEGAWCILSGPSPRGERLHSVIGRWYRGQSGCELIHDPHPDGKFFDGCEPLQALFFAVADPLDAQYLANLKRDCDCAPVIE